MKLKDLKEKVREALCCRGTAPNIMTERIHEMKPFRTPSIKMTYGFLLYACALVSERAPGKPWTATDLRRFANSTDDGAELFPHGLSLEQAVWLIKHATENLNIHREHNPMRRVTTRPTFAFDSGAPIEIDNDDGDVEK